MDGEKTEIGKVTHYFGKIGVVAIELTGSLKVGDTILIEGHGDKLEQRVDSMQIESKSVTEAKAGDGVGLKVTQKVHVGDSVYRL